MDAMKYIYQSVCRKSSRIRVDNSGEFISKELDKWAYENNVRSISHGLEIQ